MNEKPPSSWDILYEHKMINNGREREEYDFTFKEK